LARIWGELEEVEEARKLILRAETASGFDLDPKRLTATKQIVMMKSGTMPPEPLLKNRAFCSEQQSFHWNKELWRKV